MDISVILKTDASKHQVDNSVGLSISCLLMKQFASGKDIKQLLST